MCEALGRSPPGATQPGNAQQKGPSLTSSLRVLRRCRPGGLVLLTRVGRGLLAYSSCCRGYSEGALSSETSYATAGGVREGPATRTSQAIAIKAGLFFSLGPESNCICLCVSWTLNKGSEVQPFPIHFLVLQVTRRMLNLMSRRVALK